MRGNAEDSVAAYFEDYLENNFSFLFVDGSMAQVEAHLVQDTIVWHRYCLPKLVSSARNCHARP